MIGGAGLDLKRKVAGASAQRGDTDPVLLVAG
jgi:hypothetical protein